MLGKSLLLASDASPYPGYVKCILVPEKYWDGPFGGDRDDIGNYAFGFSRSPDNFGSLTPEVSLYLYVLYDWSCALRSEKEFYFNGIHYPAFSVKTKYDAAKPIWDAFSAGVGKEFEVYIKA